MTTKTKKKVTPIQEGGVYYQFWVKGEGGAWLRQGAYLRIYHASIWSYYHHYSILVSCK